MYRSLPRPWVVESWGMLIWVVFFLFKNTGCCAFYFLMLGAGWLQDLGSDAPRLALRHLSVPPIHHLSLLSLGQPLCKGSAAISLCCFLWMRDHASLIKSYFLPEGQFVVFQELVLRNTCFRLLYWIGLHF